MTRSGWMRRSGAGALGVRRAAVCWPSRSDWSFAPPRREPGDQFPGGGGPGGWRACRDQEARTLPCTRSVRFPASMSGVREPDPGRGRTATRWALAWSCRAGPGAPEQLAARPRLGGGRFPGADRGRGFRASGWRRCLGIRGRLMLVAALGAGRRFHWRVWQGGRAARDPGLGLGPAAEADGLLGDRGTGGAVSGIRLVRFGGVLGGRRCRERAGRPHQALAEATDREPVIRTGGRGTWPRRRRDPDEQVAAGAGAVCGPGAGPGWHGAAAVAFFAARGSS